VPLARPLFVYAKTESLERAKVEDFLRYMLENEASIAERAQFVPLNESQIEENLAKLDGATGNE
jgi:ABC-type phosphate transport system substrate-binding protein